MCDTDWFERYIDIVMFCKASATLLICVVVCTINYCMSAAQLPAISPPRRNLSPILRTRIVRMTLYTPARDDDGDICPHNIT